MASFSCLAIIIFLAISSFSLLNGCYGDRALIDSICKQSQDYTFCMSVVGNDPRAASADLHGLALVSISVTTIQIQDTLDKIPNILQQVKDPLALTFQQCQTDYNVALGNFQSTFTSTSNNAYSDAINFIRIGTNKVIDCHNSCRMNGPIATSPIAEDDISVFKLSGIILIAIDRLIPKK